LSVAASLFLDVRLDGFGEPIGKLVRGEEGEMAFVYTHAHLNAPSACPLSLSLPLTDEPYSDRHARPFFENLLQERDSELSKIMAREGLDRNDIVGLLRHLGKDCPGALSVLPEGAPPAKVPGDLSKDYVPIPEERLGQIVTALRDRDPLPDETQDPSPLAGVQSKIALTLLPDGRLAEPRAGSGAPTTHILKVPDRQHERDARLEDLTMGLSHDLGFPTAVAAAHNINGISTLLVTRFDRALDEDGLVVRIHQEDFAQALGLPPSMKYERRGVGVRRFDAEGIGRVLGATALPVESRASFLSATVFDLLTGNVDGHAKNHALLYDIGRSPRLSPRYDLLPTRLDARLTDELAFNIGQSDKLDDITAQDFSAFMSALGITGRGAQERFLRSTVQPIGASLAAATAGLTRNGFKDLADLIAANMRVLFFALGLPVPDEVLDRDAYIQRGGGWLASS
jgi:serine/threonine-protein kinase HipA